MGVTYHYHKDMELSQIGKILHEVHIKLLVPGITFHVADEERGMFRVYRGI